MTFITEELLWSQLLVQPDACEIKFGLTSYFKLILPGAFYDRL